MNTLSTTAQSLIRELSKAPGNAMRVPVTWLPTKDPNMHASPAHIAEILDQKLAVVGDFVGGEEGLDGCYSGSIDLALSDVGKSLIEAETAGQAC